MKAGRWRRDGSRSVGVDGLVLLRVRFHSVSADVRRKRNPSVRFKKFFNEGTDMKHTNAMRASFTENTFEFPISKNHTVALAYPFARTAKDFPGAFILCSSKKDVHRAASSVCALKPPAHARANDARI